MHAETVDSSEPLILYSGLDRHTAALAHYCRLSSPIPPIGRQTNGLVALLQSDAFPFPVPACQTPQDDNSTRRALKWLLHRLISTVGADGTGNSCTRSAGISPSTIVVDCGGRRACISFKNAPARPGYIDPGCWLAVRSTKTPDTHYGD